MSVEGSLAVEANDLESLVAENQRLKEELARMHRDPASVSPSALFRPPWQPDDGVQASSPQARSEAELLPRADTPEAAPTPAAAATLTPKKPPMAPKPSEAAARSPPPPQSAQGSGLSRQRRGAVSLPALNSSPSAGSRSVSNADSRGSVSQWEMTEVNPQQELRDDKPSPSTRALWGDYARKVSTQLPRLERNPRWKPETAAASVDGSGDGDDWEVQHSRSTQKRRDLRRQFREDRQGISTDQKRELIPGLVAPGEASRHLEMEQRKMEGHRQRIHEAIKGCSKARLDLVEMQRKMAGLAPQEHPEAKHVMRMFKDLRGPGGGKQNMDLMAKPSVHSNSLPALPEARERTLLPKAVKRKSASNRSVGFSMSDIHALE